MGLRIPDLAPWHLAPSTLVHNRHDAPPPMALALIVLAIGSIVAGYAVGPRSLAARTGFARFLEPSFAGIVVTEVAESTRLEGTLMAVSVVIAMTGIGIASSSS